MGRLFTHPIFVALRYRILLVAILLELALSPFLVPRTLGALVMDLLFILVMIAAIWACQERWLMIILGVFLVVYALLSPLFGPLPDGPELALVRLVVKGAFFWFVVLALLVDVLRQRIVTKDTVFGAACVYLLIGLAWSSLWMILEVISPGSLSLPAAMTFDPRAVNVEFERVVAYFSYVTLTTLGYGDITPVSGPARAMAAIEALLGQLYVVVLVARLVGLQIAHSEKTA